MENVCQSASEEGPIRCSSFNQSQGLNSTGPVPVHAGSGSSHVCATLRSSQDEDDLDCDDNQDQGVNSTGPVPVHAGSGLSYISSTLRSSQDEDDLDCDDNQDQGVNNTGPVFRVGSGSSLVSATLRASQDEGDSDCDGRNSAFEKVLRDRTRLNTGVSSFGNSSSSHSSQGHKDSKHTTSEGQVQNNVQYSSHSHSQISRSSFIRKAGEDSDSEDENSKRTISDIFASDEYSDRVSNDHLRGGKRFSDYGEEDEESEEVLGNKRHRRGNSDSYLKPSYLNADGSSNRSFCMLMSEVTMSEKMTEDLMKLPHSPGHQWKRPTHVPICVWVKEREEIKTVDISSTLAYITRAIYNTGSEIGYIGNIKRETSHFDVTIERLKSPVGTHPISGMFHPNLLSLLLESKDKEVMKWLVKWKLLIPNRLGTLKDKCNFTSGTR